MCAWIVSSSSHWALYVVFIYYYYFAFGLFQCLSVIVVQLQAVHSDQHLSLIYTKASKHSVGSLKHETYSITPVILANSSLIRKSNFPSSCVPRVLLLSTVNRLEAPRNWPCSHGRQSVPQAEPSSSLIHHYLPPASVQIRLCVRWSRSGRGQVSSDWLCDEWLAPAAHRLFLKWTPGSCRCIRCGRKRLIFPSSAERNLREESFYLNFETFSWRLIVVRPPEKFVCVDLSVWFYFRSKRRRKFKKI